MTKIQICIPKKSGKDYALLVAGRSAGFSDRWAKIVPIVKIPTPRVFIQFQSDPSKNTKIIT